MLRLNIIQPLTLYLQKKLNLTQDEKEIASYGLQVLVYSVTGLLSILLTGWLLGCFWTTLTAVVSAGFLRVVSGGAHSRSPLTCNLLGIVVGVSLGKTAAIAGNHISQYPLLVIITIGFVVSFFTVWRLAPVDSPAKPISSPEKRRQLRLRALAVLCSITAAQFLLLAYGQAASIILAASMGLWWQAFTLTRTGHWFATFMDNFKERGWTG